MIARKEGQRRCTPGLIEGLAEAIMYVAKVSAILYYRHLALVKPNCCCCRSESLPSLRRRCYCPRRHRRRFVRELFFELIGGNCSNIAPRGHFA